MYKRYFKTDKEGHEIKCQIDYRKAGMNWATSRPVEGGYILTAVPVEIDKKDNYSVETFGAFTGFNQVLVRCDRRSNKKFEMAINQFNSNISEYLQYFIDKGINVKLEENGK
jgi:hypothetical protein